jgi:glycosyltransferase involved in cell wall biosynthesis
MATRSSISVVLPTYNCRDLLVPHLRSMQDWLDLADEVIVVDSRSTDGTLELIRAELRHPRLRIIERDRGLYPSWNEGIAATSGEWVYISTAGDTITRQQLLRLRDHGLAAQADVVISPCAYVDEAGERLPEKAYRNPRIHRDLAGRGALLIEPPLVRHLAFRSAGTHALMGSCASDLFRGDFLRARPFPADYGTHGDTAWTLRHSHEMRLGIVPECGSTFCVHAKERVDTRDELMDILDRMFAQEIQHAGGSGYDDLALAVRQAMRARRLAKKNHGPASWAWVSANSRYLWLRTGLGFRQTWAGLRLRGLAKPLAQ